MGGMHVIILCRDEKRGKEAVEKLIAATGNTKCEMAQVDMGRLASVRAFCRSVEQRNFAVQTLINNAALPAPEGFQIMYLGHFALIMGLMDSMLRAVQKYGHATVVNIQSVGHVAGTCSMMYPDIFKSRGLTPLQQTMDDMLSKDPNNGRVMPYANAKCCLHLVGLALTRRLQSSGVRVVGFHPSGMLTNLCGIEGLDNPAAQACMTACCYKPPQLAAAGVATMGAPRSCCQVCLPGSHGNETLESVQRLLTGDGGGYYQQCCLCCVLPFQVMRQLRNKELQEDVFRMSMEALKKDAGEGAEGERATGPLGGAAGRLSSPVNQTFERGLASQEISISAGFPCTEIFTVCACCPIIC